MALFSYATKLTDAFTSPQETVFSSSTNYAESDKTTNTGRLENKVCLVILDGWGLSAQEDGNAIHKANTPVMDKLLEENSIELMSHGQHVGLPEGLMGNSEVGHLNIGAGRCVQQDILRIDQAVKENKFETNKTLLAAIGRAKQGTGRLHLAGLVSDGRVHSHIEHIFELIKVAKKHEVQEVFLHFFADGRDTAPKSGVDFLRKIMDFIKGEGYANLATIIGRYYAMDRDRQWERTRVAYEAMIGGEGEECEEDKAVSFLEGCYKGKDSDEFLKPIIFGGDEPRIRSEDTVIFFNCRADRMRQLAEVIGFGNRKHFQTKYRHPKDIGVFTMTQYNTDFGFPVLFPSPHYVNVLPEWLSVQGVSQFHCAETEKYAHITYFFNGGREEQFKHEKRCLVHSPKVETYDKQPEMSSAEIANNMVEYISTKKRPFIMCNLAAPDMVSHTGNHDAAVKAIEATDETIGWILEACQQHGYILLVTADHGNAEQMKDEKRKPHKAHTCSPVPFACSSTKYCFRKNLKLGRPPALCDVAPTILDIMGLPKPKEMTGVSLLERASEKESPQTDEKEVEEEEVENAREQDGDPKEEAEGEKETKTVEIQTELKASDIPVDKEDEGNETAGKETKKDEKLEETRDKQKDEPPEDDNGATNEKQEMKVETYPPTDKGDEKKKSKEESKQPKDESQNEEGEGGKLMEESKNNDVTPPVQDSSSVEDNAIQVKNKGTIEHQEKAQEDTINQKGQEDMVRVDKPTKIEKTEDKHNGEAVEENKREVKLPKEKREECNEEEELVKAIEKKNEECNPEGSSSSESEGGEKEVAENVANMNYMEKKGTKDGEKEEAVEVKETCKNNEEDVEVTAAKGRSKQSG